MSISETAKTFFETCEAGKGWDSCRAWCHEDATFSCQAAALAEVTTLEAYTEWTKWILTPIPDGHYELRAFAVDEGRNTVLASSVFCGTQTGDGGPVAATGNAVATDYVYSMEFDGDKIRHLTKIWNDGHALKQLGWA